MFLQDTGEAQRHMSDFRMAARIRETIENGRFVLREKLPSISLEQLQSLTGAELLVPGPVADLIVPEL